LAILGLVAYLVLGRGQLAPGKNVTRRAEPGPDPLYLPDIDSFDDELGIYFDPELGYRDIVVPETVPGEWVSTYGAGTEGAPPASDAEPPRGQTE
jgi:hypothetical protein